MNILADNSWYLIHMISEDLIYNQVVTCNGLGENAVT